MDSFAGYVPVILVVVVGGEGNWMEEEDSAEMNTEEDEHDDKVGGRRDQEEEEGHDQEEGVAVVIHIQVVASHIQGNDGHNTKIVHHVVHDNGGVVHQRRVVPGEKHLRWRVDWSRDCVLLCNHMAGVDVPHAAAADAHCDDDTPHHNVPLHDEQGEQGGIRWHSHYEPRACLNRPKKIPPAKLHYPLQKSPPNCDPVPN